MCPTGTSQPLYRAVQLGRPGQRVRNRAQIDLATQVDADQRPAYKPSPTRSMPPQGQRFVEAHPAWAIPPLTTAPRSRVRTPGKCARHVVRDDAGALLLPGARHPGTLSGPAVRPALAARRPVDAARLRTLTTQRCRPSRAARRAISRSTDSAFVVGAFSAPLRPLAAFWATGKLKRSL
jgi:hypothetical protein